MCTYLTLSVLMDPVITIPTANVIWYVEYMTTVAVHRNEWTTLIADKSVDESYNGIGTCDRKLKTTYDETPRGLTTVIYKVAEFGLRGREYAQRTSGVGISVGCSVTILEKTANALISSSHTHRTGIRRELDECQIRPAVVRAVFVGYATGTNDVIVSFDIAYSGVNVTDGEGKRYGETTPY